MLRCIMSGLMACLGIAWAQQPFNITVTNPDADRVIKGNYNPGDYAASAVVDAPEVFIPEINQRVSPDSLEGYLRHLVSFENRNTGSDTVSNTRGIGAARRWIHSKFQEFSGANENRLLVSYLRFDEPQAVCGQTRHSNVMAILPGRDAANHKVLVIEAHMDSRCENYCNTTCRAHGADDNGSGTVLVMELARVLSRYTFDHTIVFTTVTGEEQGLYGANALAEYLESNNIPVLAVQNNDVSGGIECGPAASPPGCPGEGAKDSTNIRIYSSQVNFSNNKAYARYVQLQHRELLNPLLDVSMTLNILDPVDRTGRGGDHQPFSNRGIAAIRFTEAYEHGNGGGSLGRQHTVNDLIGRDSNNDGEFEEYYVNFPYLSRNTKINGVGLAMAALSPETPEIQVNRNGQGQVQVTVTSSGDTAQEYLVGVRVEENDFEYVFRFTGPGPYVIPGLEGGRTYFVAVGSVDSNGVESLFSQEVQIRADADGPVKVSRPYARRVEGLRLVERYLAGSRQTRIAVSFPGLQKTGASLSVFTLHGRLLKSYPLKPSGNQAVAFISHRDFPAGLYHYSLLLNGSVVSTRKLIINNP